MAKVIVPLYYDLNLRNWTASAGSSNTVQKIALGQLNDVDIVLRIVQDGVVIELTSPSWILGIKELNSQSGDYLIQETTAVKTGTGTTTKYTFNFSFDSVELRAFLATLNPNEDYCALEIRDTVNGIVTAPALVIAPYASYTTEGVTPTDAVGALYISSGKTVTIQNTVTITGTDGTTYDLDNMGASDAVLYTSQTLTSPQKEQARTNIGLPTNTVGLQGADAVTLAGSNPQTPALSVTGAEFTESEVSTSGVIFSQAFSNVDEACHGISIAATSGITPNGDSSILRILSQDVEQFGFNFNGSPRINSNRQSAWRTQLGVAAKDGEAINPSSIGATTRGTIAATTGNFTGRVDAAAFDASGAFPNFGTWFNTNGYVSGGYCMAGSYHGWWDSNGDFINQRLYAINGAIQQRSGTTAQEYQLHATWTSDTVYERLSSKYDSGYGAFVIGTEKGASGGSARDLIIQRDGTTVASVKSTGVDIADQKSVRVNGINSGTSYWLEWKMDASAFAHCNVYGVNDVLKVNTITGAIEIGQPLTGSVQLTGRLGVGGAATDDNAGLLRVNTAFTSTSGNHHALMVDSVDSTLAAGAGVACITAGMELSSTAACDHLAQFQVLGGHTGAGTLGSMYCFISLPYHNGGTLTNLSHFEARDVTGSGTVTTQIGVLVKSLTRGGTNKAVVTEGTTPSDFGGLVKIGSGLTTLSGLGSAATAGASARGFITDSNAAASGNFGAVAAGGGSNKVPVYSDGTDWRIG